MIKLFQSKILFLADSFIACRLFLGQFKLEMLKYSGELKYILLHCPGK